MALSAYPNNGTKLNLIWICTGGWSTLTSGIATLQYGTQGISMVRLKLMSRRSALASILYGNAYTTSPEMATAAMIRCLCANIAPNIRTYMLSNYLRGCSEKLHIRFIPKTGNSMKFK